MSSRPTRTEWQFVTAIKLIRRINYVIFVCNIVSLLFMKYKAKAQYTMSVIYCKPKTNVSTLARNTIVQFDRYSTVQYGLVRFLCGFRTTFCASFRWCWPLDMRDVATGDVVDIFSLLGRVLVVVFARVSIGKTTSNARHNVSRKDVISGCSAACCRIANLG